MVATSSEKIVVEKNSAKNKNRRDTRILKSVQEQDSEKPALSQIAKNELVEKRSLGDWWRLKFSFPA